MSLLMSCQCKCHSIACVMTSLVSCHFLCHTSALASLCHCLHTYPLGCHTPVITNYAQGFLDDVPTPWSSSVSHYSIVNIVTHCFFNPYQGQCAPWHPLSIFMPWIEGLTSCYWTLVAFFKEYNYSKIDDPLRCWPKKGVRKWKLVLFGRNTIPAYIWNYSELYGMRDMKDTSIHKIIKSNCIFMFWLLV